MFVCHVIQRATILLVALSSLPASSSTILSIGDGDTIRIRDDSTNSQCVWLAVLQTVQPLGTGRCGCLEALVRRDCLKCSPLCPCIKAPPLLTGLVKRQIIDRDQISIISTPYPLKESRSLPKISSTTLLSQASNLMSNEVSSGFPFRIATRPPSSLFPQFFSAPFPSK